MEHVRSTKEVGNASVLTNGDRIFCAESSDTVRWKRATRRCYTTFERLDEAKAFVARLDVNDEQRKKNIRKTGPARGKKFEFNADI